MEFVRIDCFVERKTLLPILDVVIVGEIVPNVEVKGIVLSYSLNIIELCENNKGRILELEQENSIPKYISNTITAKFSISFLNENDLENFKAEVSKM